MNVRHHMALALADTRYKYPGARDEAIRHQLGMSTAQWAQVLDVLIRPNVYLSQRHR